MIFRAIEPARRDRVASRSQPHRGRIVLFTPGHSQLGGAERRSRLIVDGLASRGWEVRAVTRAGSLNRPRLRRSPGYTVLEVPGFGRRRLGGLLFLAVAFPVGIAWGLRARLFLSIQLMSTSTAAAACGLLLRRPFIGLSTTTGSLSELAYLRSTRSWKIRRRLLGRAALLLSQSDAARASLEQIVPAKRVAVLPNPVELPTRPPPLDDRPRAAFAGRFSEEKNLFALLEAWIEVFRRIPEARLTLLGAGGDFRSVETELRAKVAADERLRRSVALPGWHPEPQAILRQHDVFALPSLAEGMSNALLEACALRRIIVASDIPSNRAVLGPEYALLFDPRDVPGLSDRLCEAFENQEVRRAALLQIETRLPRFTLDAVLQRLEQLIDAADRACN